MSHYRSAPILPGTAFITGGARGLGLAIAQSFAKEGARGIALFDIQPPDTMAGARAAVEQFLAPGGRCITIHGDVTWETALDEWRHVLEVNTVGVWLSMRAELRVMLKQDGSGGVEHGRVEQRGAIVNCASVNSIQAGAGTTGYTASKHAVLGMTKAAALEARGEGVRVNCVSPGFLLTKLLEPAMKVAEGETAAKLTGDAWEMCEKRQGRKARFEEVGDVVALLCSPRMSLVAGHNLVIDNGFVNNENPM